MYGIKTGLGLLMVTSAIALSATIPAVIPLPVKMTVNDGQFVINATTVIVCQGKDAAGEADYLADAIKSIIGVKLKSQESSVGKNHVLLKHDPSLSTLGNEGYRLVSTTDGIEISAPTSAGLFYGIQTLLQLMPEEKTDSKSAAVRCVQIEDSPRFAWRGLHLDVSRHFMPAAFVKKYIDLLAMHKMNTLHWHLTDDQGWRIEIKKYPKLTEVGAWRDQTLVGHYRAGEKTYDGIRHGGFYTQEQIRDIVAYAKQRHINIVPEIEMPGHAQAAIAAYPELGCTGTPIKVRQVWGVSEEIYNVNEKTFEFLQDVLTEVLDLFDSPFIHVGGDEVPKSG